MFSMRLVRQIAAGKATIGKLYLNGIEECYTLEDKVREILGEPVASWKVPGETAIPVGTYEVDITFSNHFQRMLPLLIDVPGYEGVRIHPGNTDVDTEGCILLGVDNQGGDFIGRSRAAFDTFFIKLQRAIANGESASITIINAITGSVRTPDPVLFS